jgi:O-antigen/teichoic acid export membrane protein
LFGNLITLGTGEIAGRALQAVAFLLLARRLGSRSFGYFSLASAVTAYLLLAVQQGFDTIAVRSVVQRHLEPRATIERLLGLRLVLAIGVIALVAIYGAAGSTSPAFWLVLIFCGMHLSTALSVKWALLARETMRPVAVSVFLSNAVFLGGVLFVSNEGQAGWAAAAQLAGEAVATAYLWIRLSGSFQGLEPRFDGKFNRAMFSESWPVSIGLLLGAMLYNFDILALQWFGRAPEIGVYAAAYRCTTIVSPVLGALQSAIYPTLSRAWPNFARVRGRVSTLLALTMLALGVAALVLFVKADLALALLYGGSYGSGTPYLRVLAWVLPIQGVRVIARQVLLAWHGQFHDLRNVAFSAATNVAVDCYAIPKYGALGCAWSTLCAELVFAAACVASSVQQVRARRDARRVSL